MPSNVISTITPHKLPLQMEPPKRSQTSFLPEVASVGHSATATRKATKKNKSVTYSRIHTDKNDYVDYRTRFGEWGLPVYRVSAAEDVMF